MSPTPSGYILPMGRAPLSFSPKDIKTIYTYNNIKMILLFITMTSSLGDIRNKCMHECRRLLLTLEYKQHLQDWIAVHEYTQDGNSHCHFLIQLSDYYYTTFDKNLNVRYKHYNTDIRTVHRDDIYNVISYMSKDITNKSTQYLDYYYAKDLQFHKIFNTLNEHKFHSINYPEDLGPLEPRREVNCNTLSAINPIEPFWSINIFL